MGAAQVKEQLHKYVDLADDRMAEALLAMFRNYFQDTTGHVVAYTTKGKPLTKSEMVKAVVDAVEDVEKGNYRTTDEVRANIKNR